MSDYNDPLRVSGDLLVSQGFSPDCLSLVVRLEELSLDRARVDTELLTILFTNIAQTEKLRESFNTIQNYE